MRERAKRKPQNKKNFVNQPKTATYNGKEVSKPTKDVIYSEDGDEVVLFKAVKKSTPISLSRSESKDKCLDKPRNELPSNAMSMPKNAAFKSPIKSFESNDFGEKFRISGGGNSNQRQSLALSRIQEEMTLTLRDSLENTRTSLADSLEVSRREPIHVITSPVESDNANMDISDDFSDSLNGDQAVEEDEGEVSIGEASVGDELRAHDLYQFMRTVEEKYNSTPKFSKKTFSVAVDSKKVDLQKPQEGAKPLTEDGNQIKPPKILPEKSKSDALLDDAPQAVLTIRNELVLSSNKIAAPKSTPKGAPTVRDLLLVTPRLSSDAQGGHAVIPPPQISKPERPQLEKAKQLYEQSVSRNFRQQTVQNQAMCVVHSSNKPSSLCPVCNFS